MDHVRRFKIVTFAIALAAIAGGPSGAARLFAPFGGEKIVSVNLDGTDLRTEFVLPAPPSHRRIAVDVPTNRLYWTGIDPEEQQWRVYQATPGAGCTPFLDGPSADVGNNILDLEDLPGAGLYWVRLLADLDEQAWIVRSSLDGSGEASHDKGGPISLDLVNGRVYWGESRFLIGNTDDRLMRADLDLRNVEELLLLDYGVEDLSVDPLGGKVYWTSGGTIERANLDGSDPEYLFAAQTKHLVVDAASNSLFFTTYGSGVATIARADLDGSNRAIVVTLEGGAFNDLILVDAPVGPFSCTVAVPALGRRAATLVAVVLLVLGSAIVARGRRRTV